MSTARTETSVHSATDSSNPPQAGASRAPATYQELLSKNCAPPPVQVERTPEAELDNLLSGLNEESEESVESPYRVDPLRRLRELMVQELIPVFMQLVEKYSSAGISMRMDASNFLEGGREIRFEFAIGDHRTILLGTVTTEAIAFHETRYSPLVNGELVSGPMLRLRGLTAAIFRQFICQRLAVLLRSMLRTR
jgi:hypothetical protein